mgnify:FL=1
MITFFTRRFLQFIPTLLAVTLIVFVLLSVLPGDAAFFRAAGVKRGEMNEEAVERLREEWGLNDPIYVRYFNFLKGLVRGDLGDSFRTGESMSAVLASRLPVTLKLVGFSILLAVVGGLSLGFLAAVYKGTSIDLVSMIIAITGISIPEFWSGMMLLLLVGVYWNLLPAGGYDGTLMSLILPAVTLGFRYMALIARITRSSMLDIMNKDYVRTARSKGLVERVVRSKHVFRNALIPILTIVGLESGWILANTVIIEKVFSLPGIGQLLVISVYSRDIPAEQAGIMVIVLGFLTLNLLVDLTYGFLDPRIRYD